MFQVGWPNFWFGNGLPNPYPELVLPTGIVELVLVAPENLGCYLLVEVAWLEVNVI